MCPEKQRKLRDGELITTGGAHTSPQRAKTVHRALGPLYSPTRKPSKKQPSSPGHPSHWQRVALLLAIGHRGRGALQGCEDEDGRQAGSQLPSSSSSLSSSCSRPQPQGCPWLLCFSALTNLNPWMMMT